MRYSARMRAVFMSMIVCFAVFNSNLNLNATTFIRVSPEKLAEVSTLVVRGRCIGNVVQTRNSEIWTITSFEVRETWKGGAPAVIRIRLLGGRTPQLTSHVSGVPRFRAGEEVVIFLTTIRDGEYSIVSWAQGTFRIRRDPAANKLVVTQDTASYQDPNLPSVAVEGRAVRNLPLEYFQRRIEMALAANPNGAPKVRGK